MPPPSDVQMLNQPRPPRESALTWSDHTRCEAVGGHSRMYYVSDGQMVRSMLGNSVPKKEGQHSAPINYKLTVTFALCYQDVSLHPGKSWMAWRGPLLREDSGNLVNRIPKIRHSNIFEAVYKDNKRKSKRQNGALCFHFQKVTQLKVSSHSSLWKGLKTLLHIV